MPAGQDGRGAGVEEAGPGDRSHGPGDRSEAAGPGDRSHVPGDRSLRWWPLLGLAALQACLAEVMTPAAWARMEAGAARLQAALEQVIAARALPWSVTRLGARMELQFCARAPRDAREAAEKEHCA